MIDEPQEIRKGEDLSWENLEPYLRKALVMSEADFSVQQFHGGHANLTYLVRFGTDEYVLRRPPFGKLAPGTHSMKREYRVLSRLNPFFSQAPRAFLLCDDHTILGADFIVMERRKGVVVRTEIVEPFIKHEDIEKRLAMAMVTMEAELHTIDVEEAGLSDLGKPNGFLSRQLDGWIQRAHIAQTEEINLDDEIHRILSAETPETQRVSVIHNDIKLDNCQFQPDNPDQVSSLFDWDMTTLGDPLIDFGMSLGYWPDKDHDMSQLPVQLKGDFPPKQFLRDIYQDKTGLDLKPLVWYEAFCFWKASVISQQLYKRFHEGQTQDKRMKYFGKTAQVLADIALKKLKKR